MIRDINDPEHSLTLEELNVVVEEEKITVRVFFTTFNTFHSTIIENWTDD
jgi:hypothetical protein